MDIDQILADAIEKAAARATPLRLPAKLQKVPHQQMRQPLLVQLAMHASDAPLCDDIAALLWNIFGSDVFDDLLAIPANYRHFDQVLAAEMPWNRARPALAQALATGDRLLAVTLFGYLDDARKLEVLDDVPAISIALPEPQALLLIAILGPLKHPTAHNGLTAMRQHASAAVSLAVDVFDVDAQTPTRIAAAIDRYPADGKIYPDLACVADQGFAVHPAVHAALLRLAARCDANNHASAQAHGYLAAIFRQPAPELAQQWSRRPSHQQAALQLISRQPFDGDVEILEHIVRTSDSAWLTNEARQQLNQRSVNHGPYLDVRAPMLSLLAYDIVVELVALDGATRSVAATVESLVDDTHVGITFVDNNATWEARVIAGEYHTKFVDVRSSDATAIAQPRQRCADYRTRIATVTASEVAALPWPGASVWLAERLAAGGRIADAVDVLTQVVAKLLHVTAVGSIWQRHEAQQRCAERIIGLLLSQGRFAEGLACCDQYSLEAPLLKARCLFGLNRIAEALEALDRAAATPDVLKLRTEWRKPRSARFAKGATVMHAKFGAGTITALTGDIATVRFEQSGEKAIATRFLTEA